MVEPIFDYQFRLILIGDSTVGKSSLLKYFTDGKFAEVITHLILLLFLALNLRCLFFNATSWSYDNKMIVKLVVSC